jgi:hypothetical protein
LLSIVGLSVAMIHACLQTVTKLQQYPNCSGCQGSCIRGYVILIRCLAMGISIQPSTQHVTILKLYILPTECVVVFHMVLTINSEFFPKQH